MFVRNLLRVLIGTSIVLPLTFASTAQARESVDRLADERLQGLVVPLPGESALIAGQPVEDAPVLLAQAGDPRVAQLEEQVRRLNGALEELNFQILQMQDQIRRIQEDNELRFQEMEQRRSDGPRLQPRDHAAAEGQSSDGDIAALPRIEGSEPLRGQGERTFGTITFDSSGNFSGGGINGNGQAREPVGADNTIVAALPSGGDADDLYRNSYQFILSGDYDTAEAGFRELLTRYPDGEHAADAHFWLGEALLAQERPREAAETFLAASRQYPQAPKAPDTLFKLGVSLAAMGQHDVACATLAEVGQRFPQASGALKDRVRQERTRITC